MNAKKIFGNMSEITEYEIASDKIPSGFDGFRIAHISDLHSHPVPNVSELVESVYPDIICITGDLIHNNTMPDEKYLDFFRRLSGIAPMYFITGNHDLYDDGILPYIHKISETGGVLLDSDMTVLERNGSEIALFGVRDPYSKRASVIRSNVNAEFLKLPEYDGYKILLFHRANLFGMIKNRGFDLVLSGHMHGGQIRLPLIGGVLAPTSSMFSDRMIFPKYSGGKYTENGCTMIVNRGISNTLPFPRIGNPTEVGIITLKCA